MTRENAHPHCDTSGRVHIVMNGIVENWVDLRARLQAAGAEFSSQTDAEVVAHLVAHHLDGDLVEAVRRAYSELRGHYAFVAVSADHPGLLAGARKECPLVVGLGRGETFIASAIPAFLSETRRVQIVEDDDIVAVTPGDLASSTRPARRCGARRARWTGTRTSRRRAAMRPSC